MVMSMSGERYIRAQNLINKMTTLETDIKFQISSSQFNISKLNAQNTLTCSNNEYKCNI